MTEIEKQRCVISNCGNEATKQVSYAHANPDLRWSEKMCDACAKDAFDRGVGAGGEFIFSRIAANPV